MKKIWNKLTCSINSNGRATSVPRKLQTSIPFRSFSSRLDASIINLCLFDSFPFAFGLFTWNQLDSFMIYLSLVFLFLFKIRLMFLHSHTLTRLTKISRSPRKTRHVRITWYNWCEVQCKSTADLYMYREATLRHIHAMFAEVKLISNVYVFYLFNLTYVT